MATTTTTKSDTCRRCKGKGFGDWVVQHGICFRCQGTGRESSYQQRVALERQQAAWAADVQDVPVTIEATSARDARLAIWQAFDSQPRDLGTEVAAGVWVVLVLSHSAQSGWDADGKPVYEGGLTPPKGY